MSTSAIDIYGPLFVPMYIANDRLFFGKSKSLTPLTGILSTMPVKKAGLGLQNPVTSADEKYLSSRRASTELIRAVTGEGEFSTADHFLTLREERRDGQKRRDDANGAKIKELVDDLKAPDHRLILRTKNTGSWLNVRGTTVTGTVLAAIDGNFPFSITTK